MLPTLDRNAILRHRGGENGCLSEIWIYGVSRGGQDGRNSHTPITSLQCVPLAFLPCVVKNSLHNQSLAGDSPPPETGSSEGSLKVGGWRRDPFMGLSEFCWRGVGRKGVQSLAQRGVEGGVWKKDWSLHSKRLWSS